MEHLIPISASMLDEIPSYGAACNDPSSWGVLNANLALLTESSESRQTQVVGTGLAVMTCASVLIIFVLVSCLLCSEVRRSFSESAERWRKKSVELKELPDTNA